MQALCCSCLLVAGAMAASASDDSPRRYEITIETGMPHLEENLRYAIGHAERCLSHTDLDTAFPVLQHPSLAGCKLRERSRAADTASYALICEHSPETTGTATWHLTDHSIRGTLEVKLGGKNMTFFQRITGKPTGRC